MSKRFDDILKNSAAAVPDPGEFRRLNRAVLRQDLDSPRSSSRHRPGLAFVGAAAVFFMLLGGFENILVSYDWELVDVPGLTGIGTETIWRTDPYSGRSFNTSGSEARDREWQQAFAAQDGILTGVSLVALDGAQCWVFQADYVIQGKIESSALENPPGYPCETIPRLGPFYEKHYKDIKKIMAEQPHDRTEVIHVYEQDVLVRYWTRDFPGFDQVTFAQGEILEAETGD